MIVLQRIKDMKAFSHERKAAGATIGLVPTMGYLHEGHLSLVRECRANADATVVSIFVNPAQFGPNEDLQSYPRDLRQDVEMVKREGVDVVFAPPDYEMYPPGYRTFVEVHELQDRLCGRTRPGHFRGVCTIVLKLFNIVGPDIAFFGWKDAQQLIILRKMAKDLNLDVKVEGIPLVRDAEGLALSSRNSYLSAKERRAALVLSKGLREAEAMARAGEKSAKALISKVIETIREEPLACIDYVDIVSMDDFAPLERIDGDALIALAVHIGKTRLIDNIRISDKG
jgi:pantoate--beta-alanine ligase